MNFCFSCFCLSLNDCSNQNKLYFSVLIKVLKKFELDRYDSFGDIAAMNLKNKVSSQIRLKFCYRKRTITLLCFETLLRNLTFFKHIGIVLLLPIFPQTDTLIVFNEIEKNLLKIEESL